SASSRADSRSGAGSLSVRCCRFPCEEHLLDRSEPSRSVRTVRLPPARPARTQRPSSTHPCCAGSPPCPVGRYALRAWPLRGRKARAKSRPVARPSYAGSCPSSESRALNSVEVGRVPRKPFLLAARMRKNQPIFHRDVRVDFTQAGQDLLLRLTGNL